MRFTSSGSTPVFFFGIFFFFFLSKVAVSLEPFEVTARSAVLMDALSDEVVFTQNPEEKIGPASLSKIMTLYLAYDALKNGHAGLGDSVIVSERAWRMGGSQMFIEVGESVKFDDLLKGIAISSGNDACVAVAEYLAGTEEVFVDNMNKKAKELGLKNTVFKDSSGLPQEGQYTTALDMARLARRLALDHPEALEVTSLREFKFNGISQPNRNKLIFADEGVDGLKTGYTQESGYHLVATAKKDGQRFIAVVMGTENDKIREREALKLLNYGFRNFSTVRFFGKGEVLKKIEVWKGKKGEVELAAEDSGIITLPKEQEKSVSVVYELPNWITAPVEKGSTVGKAYIKLQGKTIKQVNMVTKEKVPEAWGLVRLWHSIILFFKSL